MKPYESNLYQSTRNFGREISAFVGGIVVGGLIAIISGSQPTFQQNKDLTGDKIPDAIVDVKYGVQNGTWLFIGQEDGSFIRARQHKNEGIKYFKTKDGTYFFFDGEFYKQLPKQE